MIWTLLAEIVSSSMDYVGTKLGAVGWNALPPLASENP